GGGCRLRARLVSLIASSAQVLTAATADAQGAPTTPYGAPITLEQAKKMVAGAEAEALKNNWPVAIAVLDSGGHLVLLHRMDNTQIGSIEVARDKAYS